MSDKALVQRFDAWRREGRTLVLATVVSTEGSTYSKPGHRILVADNGDCQGLVSGGCLEGDLALHAVQVIASGASRIVSYNLRQDSDGDGDGDGDEDGEQLFGLGIGCDGLLRILLQRLTPAEGYEPFASVAKVLRGDTAARCAVVLVDSGDRRIGETLITAGGSAGQPERSSAEVLYTRLTPLPRLLVLGAGPDAVPIVSLADALGWRVTLVDHRPAHLQRPEFAVAESTVCALAVELESHVPLATIAAAIVMSHHLATDRSYLHVLAGSPVPYIGLLGPAGRRDRLLRELDTAAVSLEGRLRGPAGLDIGANSPESIALAILAEIHATVRDR